MNYRRGTKISSGLFLTFLILILITGRAGRPEAVDAVEMEEVSIIDEHVGNIAAVAINHDSVRFGLIHQPTGILLEPASAGAELSQEEMQSFLYRLSKLKALGKIPQNEDLAAYGLENPRARMTLILQSGKKVRLSLGNVNPVGGSSYLLKEGSGEIFLLSDVDSRLLTVLPDDFYDRRVLPPIEMSELDLIREISLDFESEANEDFTITNSSRFEFRLTEPFGSSLDYESVLSEMIFPLVSLIPDRIAESEEFPDKQDAPGFRLSLLLGDERFNLIFRETEDSWFILREDNQRVYQIQKEAVPWGNLRYRDLLKETIYHVNISLIGRIEIRVGEALYALELSGRSTELEGELNGIPMEYPAVMELYQTIFSTGIADIVHGTEPAGIIEASDPDLTITVFKKSGAIDTLEFFTRNGEESFVVVNGELNFTTYNRALQTLLRKVSNTAS